jgi:hypothetical protein
LTVPSGARAAATFAASNGKESVEQSSYDGNHYILRLPGQWEVGILLQAPASHSADTTALVRTSSIRQRLVCSVWLRLTLADCWRRNLRVRTRQLRETPRLATDGLLTGLQSAAHTLAEAPSAIGAASATGYKRLCRLFSSAPTSQEAAAKAIRKQQKGGGAAGGVPSGCAEIKMLTGIAAGDVPTCTALVDYAGEAYQGVGLGPPNQLQRPRVIELASAAARREAEPHPGYAKLKVTWVPKHAYKRCVIPRLSTPRHCRRCVPSHVASSMPAR